jgi:hypothetical protein
LEQVLERGRQVQVERREPGPEAPGCSKALPEVQAQARRASLPPWVRVPVQAQAS